MREGKVGWLAQPALDIVVDNLMGGHVSNGALGTVGQQPADDFGRKGALFVWACGSEVAQAVRVQVTQMHSSATQRQRVKRLKSQQS